MKGNKVIQIVPELPPAVNGLGDYAYKLGLSFRDHGWESIFITTGNYIIEDFECYQTARTAKEFVKLALEQPTSKIFVNYVPYAYHKRGVPYWLTSGLMELKLKHKFQVYTFFHEIFASGKVWNSSFWLRPFQKRIFHQLYDISNHCFTNAEKVTGIIQNECKDCGAKTNNIGLFSNIPEASWRPNFSQKKNNLIVFGSLALRKLAYQSLEAIRIVLKNYQIDQLIDIGHHDEELLSLGSQLPIQFMNCQPASVIAQIMAENKYGLINYNLELMGKSGVFAAYAAHGTVIINLNEKLVAPMDGLVCGFHYIDARTHFYNLEEISNNAYYWYQCHNLQKHTKSIVNIISK